MLQNPASRSPAERPRSRNRVPAQPIGPKSVHYARNLAPDGGAVIKLAGVEGGMAGGRFAGRARVFDSEAALIEALATVVCLLCSA